MRCLLVLIVVAFLSLAVAGAVMANADGTMFFLQAKAGWYDGSLTVQNSAASFGASAVPDTSLSPLSPAGDNIATTDGVQAWMTDKVAGNAVGYTFTLVVAPGTGPAVSDHPGDVHESMCYISLWNLDTWAGATGHTLPSWYMVAVSGANIVGRSHMWYARDLYLTERPGTTEIGPVGFWYRYQGHYTAWSEALAAGETFTVTIGALVPEPTSLLALGSSLIGLAGFAVRRRRP